MENKNWLVGLVVLVIIVAVGIWGFGKNNIKKEISGAANNAANTEEPVVSGSITGKEAYFDANAKVMYFYQPTCHYCLLQSPILSELALEGYRVKPMNAAADPTVWEGYEGSKYNITGTPSFIAENGDKMSPGMQEKDALKTFLDAHK